MGGTRLDVGFVPVECPGNTGRGAMHTSTLLIEHLSQHHDLTVYVASQQTADRSALPARDRVDYVLHDGLDWLPHPIRNKHAALSQEQDALDQHDMVHSYSSAFIPVLAELGAPTLVTLNSYLPVCPKANFLYHGTDSCTGPGPAKCAACIPATAVNRRRGVRAELKTAYLDAARYPFVRRSIGHRDAITRYQALSPHLRRDYAGVGFDPERISVIPHFYDDRFRVAETERDARSDEAPTLLYVGALKEMKGVDVLIEAVPSLLEIDRDIEVRIVGDGPMEEQLRERVDELGVSSSVTWCGYVDHDRLPRYYREADVFVYPGILDEPFGRVMLEALASGTPIVSSDIGSMDTIVGPAGELFAAGDPMELATGVDTVLDEYGRYQDAIDEHLEQFSPSAVLQQFNELYAETASAAG